MTAYWPKPVPHLAMLRTETTHAVCDALNGRQWWLCSCAAYVTNPDQPP